MAVYKSLARYWYRALGEPLGIWIKPACAPERAKSLLYTSRAQARDPALAHLSLRTAPPGDIPGCGPATHIWIVNPEREAPTPLNGTGD